MEAALAVSQAKYWHLRQFGLFSGLADWQLRQLVAISELRLFKAGELIHSPGEPATRVHLVRNGKVKLMRAAGGKELILDYLGEGEIFADSSLTGCESYAERAIAAEDCFLCIIDRRSFLGFLGDNPRVSMQIVGILARRKMRADQRLLELLTLDVRTRLARALLELAERFGTPDQDDLVLDLRLTQTELGQLVGSTRETTSTAFNGFRREGWVESDDRRIRLLDREALAAV